MDWSLVYEASKKCRTNKQKRRQPKHPQKKNTPHLSLSLSVFPRGEQRVCARAPNENSKQQQL